jgi:hypothetical protein
VSFTPQDFFPVDVHLDSYRSKHKLAGIIFLYEISQARLTPTSRAVLSMLEAFCGNEAAKNVAFVTTRWDCIGESLEERERQLKEPLNGLLDHGMHMTRFRPSSPAWDVIDHILGHTPVDAIQIQRDLVDRRLPLVKTSAAIDLGAKTLRRVA